ncbi:protein phosphatase [Planctomycetota bacterium]
MKGEEKMVEVLSGKIWLGHAFDVRQPRELFDHGISAVVDVAYEESPAQLPRQLVYCRFPLNDGEGNDPMLIRLAVDSVVNCLSIGMPTLVACSAGMSRSPSIAAVALAIHLGESPTEVLQRFSKSKALEVSPQFWSAAVGVWKSTVK